MGLINVGQNRTNQFCQDVNALEWESDAGGRIKAEAVVSKEGEIERLFLKIYDNRKTLYETVLEIDWDMGGGGFLKGMQFDDDLELEIVFATKGGKNNFYLDIKNGEVIKRDFSLGSREAQHQAEMWLNYNVPNPFSVGFWFVVSLIFYLLYFPVYMVIKIVFVKVRSVKSERKIGI